MILGVILTLELGSGESELILGEIPAESEGLGDEVGTEVELRK